MLHEPKHTLFLSYGVLASGIRDKFPESLYDTLASLADITLTWRHEYDDVYHLKARLVQTKYDSDNGVDKRLQRHLEETRGAGLVTLFGVGLGEEPWRLQVKDTCCLCVANDSFQLWTRRSVLYKGVLAEEIEEKC